jgi:general secretion pathway protein K
MTTARPHMPRRPARGAAILIAMVLLTVVATLASGMVWQQWRGIEVEAAERSRTQSGWMLTGGLDFARLILRQDNNTTVDTLAEPWARGLQETSLASLLAADRENNADSTVDAFIDGGITDAQSRYNLRNLVADNKLVPAQVQVLERLFTNAGLPPSQADEVANAWLNALLATSADAPLLPQQLADLAWFGLDGATLARLAPLLVILPQATPVNANTALREVLAAVIPGIGLGGADRLVQARESQPFKELQAVASQLGGNTKLEAGDVDVKSSYFEVRGRVRIDSRVLEEQTLLQRRGQQLVPLQRLRRAALAEAPR